jgi:hypothetical protein
MRKVIAALTLFFFVASSFAQGRHVDTDGLTDVQRAKLYEYVAVEKEKNNKKNSGESIIPNAPPPEKLNVWVEAGVNLGKGLAEAAKQLGVAANEFVKTPVGMLTAGVILYKFIGKDLIKLVVGSTFLVVFGSTWIYFFRRICVVDRITYEEKPHPKNDKKILKSKETVFGDRWSRTSPETVFVFFVMAIAGSATGLGVIFL